MLRASAASAVLAFLLALALGPSGAAAQEPEAEPAEEEPAAAPDEEEAEAPATPEGVERIVVTITKREEVLQDVAGSITAFDAEQLQNADIQNVADALSLIPNVQIKGDGNEAISIRGISQSFTSQSPVAQHMNGVFKFDGRSYSGQFYDIRALEVARGPSGTVYGRNATAGAINLRWNEPTSALEAFGDYTMGNYDLYQFRGGVNLPFTGEDDETLMGRFVFTRQEHDGYIDNVMEPQRSHDPDNADDFMLRGSLLSRPNEDLALHLRSYWTQSKFTPTASHSRTDEYPVGVFALPGLPTGDAILPFDAYNGLDAFIGNVPRPALGIPGRGWLGNAFLRLVSQTAVNQGFASNLREGTIYVVTHGLEDFFGSAFPPFLNEGAFTNVVGSCPPDAESGTCPVPSGDHRVRNARHDAFPNDEDYTIFGLEHETDWTLGEVEGFGDVALTFLGGWERTHYDQAVDPDSSELLLADTVQIMQNDLYTAELRLASQSWESFDWIAGIFWFQRRQDFHSQNYTPFGDASCGLCPFLAEELNKDKGFAPFASGFYRPIPEVELSAGVRWNRDEVESSRNQPAVGPRAGDAYDGESVRFRELTGEVGAKWFWTEGKMLYGKWGRGYKAGGFNDERTPKDTDDDPSTPDELVLEPFDPELVDAWEVGSKNSFFDERLHLNLTGFWYDYTDLQVPKVTGLNVITDNAAEATIWGVELEAITQPFERVTLAAAIGYLDATFDEFCSDDPADFTDADDPACAGDPGVGLFDGKQDLEGHRLEDSPKWKASLYAAYDLELGDRGTLTPVVEFTWTDEYYLRPQNDSVDRVGDYTKTDVRLIWRSPTQRWTMEAFVENLENELVYARNVYVAEFSNMMSGFGMLPPRTYGVRVGFHWGGLE